MKKTFCTALALIMLTAAFAGFAGCAGGLISTTYRDAESYTVGNFSYNASAVEAVTVDWLSGEVNVVISPAGELKVSETGGTLTASQKLHWFLDGTVLRIQFCKSGYSGRFPDGSKKLTVEVPAGVKLNIDATSADIRFSGSGRLGEAAIDCTSGNVLADVITADSLSVNATSGSTEIGVVTAETLDVYTASGSCTVGEINARAVNFDSTSGGMTAGLRACEEMNADTTSGDVHLTSVPSNGAEISFDHTSGKFTYRGAAQEDELTIGAGFCRISVSTTSGDLTID